MLVRPDIRRLISLAQCDEINRLRSAMSIGATERSVVFIVPTTYHFQVRRVFVC